MWCASLERRRRCAEYTRLQRFEGLAPADEGALVSGRDVDPARLSAHETGELPRLARDEGRFEWPERAHRAKQHHRKDHGEDGWNETSQQVG
jgi:hypothetical protein